MAGAQKSGHSSVKRHRAAGIARWMVMQAEANLIAAALIDREYTRAARERQASTRPQRPRGRLTK
jgi:hypothetical protein